MEIDSATGGVWELVGDIIKAAGGEDSSGFRRHVAQKLDPLVRAVREEERERCAVKAERLRDASHPDFASYHDCDAIARAIRSEP